MSAITTPGPSPANNAGRPAPALRAGLFVLLLSSGCAVCAEDRDIQVENKEVELESLRSKIRDVQSSIDAARSDSEAYLKEIQELEQAAAAADARLQDIESDIKAKTARLQRLQQEQTGWQQSLEEQRHNLARQIRIAYKTGRHDFLKLLLNQEDPALVGRMVTYHEYYSRARAEKIRKVQETLERIAALQTSINEETDRLKKLRAEQVAKLMEYREYRDSRRQAINELRAYIEKQDQQLQHLQRNEEELTALLERLKSEQLAIQVYEELPPFQSLQGKLTWPVEGRFLYRYGETRKGGKLRTHGVRIAAEGGTDVHAVSAGKVVFADWFRTLGLLMIIDHGNGFMSLYGNNERLLKKPGDMVAGNEIVAKVGDTGGQTETGLYFEIRRQGSPRNPALWCKR